MEETQNKLISLPFSPPPSSNTQKSSPNRPPKKPRPTPIKKSKLKILSPFSSRLFSLDLLSSVSGEKELAGKGVVKDCVGMGTEGEEVDRWERVL